MLKIAITGSNGLIGSRIIELLANDFEFTCLDLPNFNITQKPKVVDTLNSLRFDIFCHLAAYTNVDLAEKEENKTRQINVDGTDNVFNQVLKKKKKFILASTDFVFDGKKGPYFEDGPPRPLSVYAKSKFEAEQLVKDKGMIVRFSYPYRTSHPSRQDFVRSLRRKLDQNQPVALITDSLITPTFIDDIAYALKYLFEHFTPSMFHIVGGDSLSPFEAGRQIADVFKYDQRLLTETNFSEYSKGKALRPQYSNIKSKKNDFYKMKTFKEGLKVIKSQILNSNF